jgi:hypothetical protein
MAFQLSQNNPDGSTGNYWVLISVSISRFPIASAQAQIVYGLFLSSDAYQSGDVPMSTESFVLPASLTTSISGSMITTLETFLSTMQITNADGTKSPGFFNGAQQVS